MCDHASDTKHRRTGDKSHPVLSPYSFLQFRHLQPFPGNERVRSLGTTEGCLLKVPIEALASSRPAEPGEGFFMCQAGTTAGFDEHREK